MIRPKVQFWKYFRILSRPKYLICIHIRPRQCLFCQGFYNQFRQFSQHKLLKEPILLGIESSCDDTGAAIINGNGTIIGEGYASQVETSVKFGGVLPSIAQVLHKKNIHKVIEDSFRQACISTNDLTAVAATIKPGQNQSLIVGCNYGVDLAVKNKIPFIPIHHMEAHALTARMIDKIEFPFICILLSGGHSLITLAQAIDRYSIVGESISVAVGVIFDKFARRLKARNISEIGNICCGAAVEKLAEGGDPLRFQVALPMTNHRNSNMAFSSVGSHFIDLVISMEKEQDIEGGRVLPLSDVRDLCASFQYILTKHILRKTQYAFHYLEYKELIPKEKKTVVLSGGVASNKYIRNALELLCSNQGYRLVVPPPKLCTDNGVMIAWNALERWRHNIGILRDPQEIKAVQIQTICPIGPSFIEDQTKLNLKRPKWFKF